MMLSKISLATSRPDLIEDWHQIKNGNLIPNSVTPHSGKKVWWLCKTCHHEWKTMIAHRTNGSGCPKCSYENRRITFRTADNDTSLATKCPDLAKEWHPKNDFTPSDIKPGAHRKAWWFCHSCKHEWQAMIYSRACGGRGCPKCRNPKLPCYHKAISQSLAVIAPILAAEFHPTKNDMTAADIKPMSNKKVWWLGVCGHQWQARICDRFLGSKCPYCCNMAVGETNCLATINPTLASEWHPIKNGNLTSHDIVPGKQQKAWWLCGECNYEWKARIDHRSNGIGCPACCKSKGEKAIASILMKYEVSYHPQFKFDDCRNVNRLSFDFMVERNEQRYLVEYHGRQHYEPVDFGSKSETAAEKLAITKKRDEIKRQFCIDNHLPLLEIPHWESHNIEAIVVEFLNL